MTNFKLHKKILAWALTLIMSAAVIACPAPAFADSDDVMRLAGADRFETSAVISLFMYEDDEADAIVLVNGLDFPDALAAAPFASSVNAPILMVNGPAGLFNPAVAEEIDRIDSNHDADVYIIGGTGAVSEEIEKQLRAAEYKNITRIYGNNRFETAVRVARNIDDKQIAFITNGMNYPDALGAGSAASLYGGAILFTGTDKLDAATRNYLEHISFDTVVILGGEGAVSKAVEEEICLLQDEVVRVEGKDRYETCLALAEICFEETETAVVATGADFADALAGGPFAAMYGAPILLVDPSKDYVDDNIRDYIIASGAKYIAVLGGEGAVNADIYKSLSDLVR